MNKYITFAAVLLVSLVIGISMQSLENIESANVNMELELIDASLLEPERGVSIEQIRDDLEKLRRLEENETIINGSDIDSAEAS